MRRQPCYRLDIGYLEHRLWHRFLIDHDKLNGGRIDPESPEEGQSSGKVELGP